MDYPGLRESSHYLDGKVCCIMRAEFSAIQQLCWTFWRPRRFVRSGRPGWPSDGAPSRQVRSLSCCPLVGFSMFFPCGRSQRPKHLLCKESQWQYMIGTGNLFLDV